MKRRLTRFSMLCVLVVATFAQHGCGGAQKTAPMSDSFDLEMQFSAHDETGSDRLYRVDPNGAISFGGGFQALTGSTPWIGTMTQQEEKDLLEAIQQQGWFMSAIESTNDPKERVYRITVKSSQGHKRFKVVGRNERVEAVEAVLERICRKRFDEDLKRLPEPDIHNRPATQPATQPAPTPSP